MNTSFTKSDAWGTRQSVIAVLMVAFCAFSVFWLVVLEELAVVPPMPAVGHALMIAGVFAVAAMLRWRIGLALAAAYSALLVSLWLWPTSRIQFLRDLAQVQPGMSREEVMFIMGKYQQGTGWPALYGTNGPADNLSAGEGQDFKTPVSPSGQLEIADSVVFRHDPGEADWGVVEMRSNRVKRVSFLPD